MSRSAEEHVPVADEKTKKEQEFIKDPIAYMDKAQEERVKPLVDQYLDDAAKIQRELSRSQLKDFDKYADKIDAFMQGVDPRFRKEPKTWEIAHKLARIDELDKRESELNAREGVHVESGGGGVPPEKPTVPELTAEEKAVAAQFGIESAEEFRKWSDPGYQGEEATE